MPVGYTWPLQTGDDGIIETSDDPEVLCETWVTVFALSGRGRRPKKRRWGAGIDAEKFRALTTIPRGTSDAVSARLATMEGQIPVLIDNIDFIGPRETGEFTKGKWEVTVHMLGDAAEESVVVEVP